MGGVKKTMTMIKMIDLVNKMKEDLKKLLKNELRRMQRRIIG
jgi:hypothetical protein